MIFIYIFLIFFISAMLLIIFINFIKESTINPFLPFFLLIFSIYGYGAIISKDIDYEGLFSENVNRTYLYAIILMLIVLTIGSLFIRGVKVNHKNINNKFGDLKIFNIIFGVAIYCIIAYVLGRGVDIVIGFATRSLQTDQLWDIRSSNTKMQFLTTIINVVKPVATSWAFMMYIKSKDRKGRRYLIIILFADIVFGLSTLHKSKILEPFIIIAFNWLFLKMARKISIKNIISAGIFVLVGIFVFLPVAYLLQYPLFSYGVALQQSVNRIFFEPNRVLKLNFVFYPQLQNYLYGSSSHIIAFIKNDSNQIPPNIFIANYFGNYNSVWNSCYIGDAWADFGYIGVAAFSILLIILFIIIQKIISSCRDDSVKVIYCTSFSMLVINFLSVGFLTSINSYGIMWEMSLFIIINKLIKDKM